MITRQIEHPKVVSRAEWLAARKELLVKEKQLTRQRDEVDRQRRELPWVKVDKEYFFHGPNGQRPWPISLQTGASSSCPISCLVPAGRRAVWAVLSAPTTSRVL